MTITFVFHGEPVPASRPRVTRHGTYTPPKYADYKQRFARMLALNFGDQDIPPPNSKERTKWLKSTRYLLNVTFYCARQGLDLDNLVKGVMDALQDAGMIGNDSQIDHLIATKLIDKESPRTELRLIRI